VRVHLALRLRVAAQLRDVDGVGDVLALGRRL